MYPFTDRLYYNTIQSWYVLGKYTVYVPAPAVNLPRKIILVHGWDEWVNLVFPRLIT